jgi:transcriptional regulator with XRE-family HTH domain
MNERERIELLMKCYELTPSQFADRTGIQRASVSHIISGRNKPSLEILQKIYEAFPELDIKWLMTGKGDEPSSPVSASALLAEDAARANTLFSQQYEHNEPVAPITAQPKVVAEPQRSLSKTPVVSKPAVERQQRRMASTRASQTASVDKKIKEIRIFYTDGTYETLFPEK